MTDCRYEVLGIDDLGDVHGSTRTIESAEECKAIMGKDPANAELVEHQPVLDEQA